MNKVIKIINEEKKIVQITTIDERWYDKPDDKGNSLFYPSVTWICEYYPKGIGFYKWLADKGWDEAEALKTAAGDKGSKVHSAISDLLDGQEVPMDKKYLNNTTGKEEELTLEEYDCLISFRDWWREAKPITLAHEVVIFSEDPCYAGTIDWIGLINNRLTIIDWKTSPSIWPSYRMQISAYKQGVVIQDIEYENKTLLLNLADLAILQLGYRYNKKRFKFTPIEDEFELFKHAYAIWDKEVKDKLPRQKDYPESLCLNPKDKEE